MAGDPGDLTDFSPFLCSKCHNDLQTPCRLSCQHIFCLSCIDSEEECPICTQSFDKTKLKPDEILNYLIESSKETSEKCGNCDEPGQLFFCETCQQPLCSTCKTVTHQAKIFQNHQILPLEESGKQRGNILCNEHKSPFILYCQEARQLMCIDCFNGSSMENRNHFVSIDAAHKICQEQLNESVVLLRSFQNELEEQVFSRKQMAINLGRNGDEIKQRVNAKYDLFVQRLTAVKDRILTQIEKSKEERLNQVVSQLRTLTNIERPIKLNLLSASVFCSYASQLDLLHSFSDLMVNIKYILARKMTKLPFNAEFKIDFINEFANAMKEELDIKMEKTSDPLNLMNSTFPMALLLQIEEMENDDDESSKSSSYIGRGILKELNHNVIDLPTNAKEQFHRVEEPLKRLQHEAVQISKQLLDIQRDITLRRCLVDKKTVETLMKRGESLMKGLQLHNNTINETEPVLFNLWAEQLDTLRRQYNRFQQKKEELSSLQLFSKQVLGTVLKLKPLCSFLSSVISVVDERRSGITEIPPMEQICLQILTLSPDSKQRCEAIKKEEENRRAAQEKEKEATKDEVKQISKSLKETPKKARPVSMIMIENTRDRPCLPLPIKKKKRTKRSSQSDESSGLRSPSPRGMLSPATSLDTVSIDLKSPLSLSPVPPKEDRKQRRDSELSRKGSSHDISVHHTSIPFRKDRIFNDTGLITSLDQINEDFPIFRKDLFKNPLPLSPKPLRISPLSIKSPSPSLPTPLVSPLAKNLAEKPLESPHSSNPESSKPLLTSLSLLPPKPPESPSLPPKPETPKTPKALPYGPTDSRDAPSVQTVKAREMLLQSIKERVKRID